MKPMSTKQVRSPVTLRALERRGLIKEPSEIHRPKGKRWGAGYSYVDADPGTIRMGRRRFTVQFADGCMFPFVWEQFGGPQA